MDGWEEVRQRAQAQGVSPHLILREQVHLLILDQLFRQGAFSELVLQGATALRIASQGVRFEEGLGLPPRPGHLPERVQPESRYPPRKGARNPEGGDGPLPAHPLLAHQPPGTAHSPQLTAPSA